MPAVAEGGARTPEGCGDVQQLGEQLEEATCFYEEAEETRGERGACVGVA